MNNSPSLQRIRRVAAGISVAAILAIAGLTVEIAWEEGTFSLAVTEAPGILRELPPSWTPTPSVQNMLDVRALRRAS
ncbi:hypothetical protein K7711_22730 [Nocardia sp. CA2R105]|uniref:hypothetical protein n=1 Tax=Nocardia coffeae TaxID=2873381 RepID=UPI001CA6AB89|nr:hypothetical protein [Nocardia coffeae]MBY8859304.1 hypothetical protein [Nocardia coffeae]